MPRPGSPTGNPTGRPTKFSQQAADRCLTALRLGAYLETVSSFGGISRDTLNAWIREGHRARYRAERLVAKTGCPLAQALETLPPDLQNLVRFSDAYQKAADEAELRALTLITQAAEREWQAAAWLLERRRPERWGRRRIELTGEGGGPVAVAQVYLPDNGRGRLQAGDDDEEA